MLLLSKLGIFIFSWSGEGQSPFNCRPTIPQFMGPTVYPYSTVYGSHCISLFHSLWVPLYILIPQFMGPTVYPYSIVVGSHCISLFHSLCVPLYILYLVLPRKVASGYLARRFRVILSSSFS